MKNTYSVCSESIFKQSEKEKKNGKYIFFFLVRDFFPFLVVATRVLFRKLNPCLPKLSDLISIVPNFVKRGNDSIMAMNPEK